MALKTRKISPQQKIKERSGFATASRVPDYNQDKIEEAKRKNNVVDPVTGLLKPIVQEYTPPKPHKFRDEFEVEPGMADFILSVK